MKLGTERYRLIRLPDEPEATVLVIEVRPPGHPAWLAFQPVTAANAQWQLRTRVLTFPRDWRALSDNALLALAESGTEVTPVAPRVVDELHMLRERASTLSELVTRLARENSDLIEDLEETREQLRQLNAENQELFARTAGAE